MFNELKKKIIKIFSEKSEFIFADQKNAIIFAPLSEKYWGRQEVGRKHRRLSLTKGA